MKFHYLRNYLQGSTLSVIAGLSLTSENCDEAVQIIKDVHNKIETYARNLKKLNVDRNQYGLVLISIIMTKLPLK